MNEFQRIQMLNELQEESTVRETRKKLNEIVNYFKSLPTYAEDVELFASKKWRDLDPQILKDADSFMVRDTTLMKELPEELRHESYGFVREGYLVYSGRFVYPIKDTHGDVAGFVGYDNELQPKYLDSKNHGYKAKRTMLAGMENLKSIYNSTDSVVITEGLVCSLWLRSQGVQSLALLGVYTSEYTIRMLKRLGKRVVVVYDNDKAGDDASRRLKSKLKIVTVTQPKLAKDIDDMRKLPNVDVDELINELKTLTTSPISKLKYFK